MRFVTLVVVLVGVVVGAGCGVSPEQTAKMWKSVERSLGRTSGTQQALLGDVAFTFSIECDEGGDADLTAKLDFSGDRADTSTLFGYDVAYDHCAPDEDNTLDGELRYFAQIDTQVTDTSAGVAVDYFYQGEVTSTGETNGTCDVDVVGHVRAAAGEGPGDEFAANVDIGYDGTICGHDAHEVLQARADLSDEP